MTLLEYSLLNNPVEKWLLAIGIALVATFLLYIFSKVLARTFAAFQGKMPGELPQVLSDMLRRTKVFVLLIVSVYAGSRVLSLPSPLATSLRYVAVILAGIQIGLWAGFLVTKLVSEYVIRKTDKEEVPSGIAVATLVARVIVWAFIILLVLDNLGFNITTLIAGLGVGGIAIAMASQSVLADLFASLSILLDKPFKVGEFIIVGDMLGSVEHIGLKTTRLRSLSGEQLVFSNGDLLSSRIRNYKRMQERRVVFTIGVEYSTAYETLKRIPGMIREIIESISRTRFDRSHFMSYGDFSLNIETVYYVLAPDYNTYADIQQEINLRLFERFEKEGIIFAFPTRTVHLAKDDNRQTKLHPMGEKDIS
jgi:small-conductance mechanosensitive channel